MAQSKWQKQLETYEHDKVMCIYSNSYVKKKQDKVVPIKIVIGTPLVDLRDEYIYSIVPVLFHFKALDLICQNY